MRKALVTALGGLLVLVLLAAAPAWAERQPLDIRVFARIGEPGQPEPIAVGPRDGRVYVGTNQQGLGDAAAPSRIFVLSRRGEPAGDYVLRGQELDSDHGIQGLAFDGRGLLYALDRSADPRVVAIGPRLEGQRDYASFRDVPSCMDAGRSGNCSATVGDQPSAPDYAAFAPNGDLYVTDIDQALIWRVPAGGGRPEVWFTDPRLENVYGPNGIQLEADGRTLLLAVTATGLPSGNPTAGALYELPIRADGEPGPLRLFWRSRPLDGPDGFALARSGNVYVALAGASQIALISSAGEELARVPESPLANQLMPVPLDGPASAAFLGRRVLVTNQSPFVGNPRSWAVLDLFAGEPGLPLNYPRF